METGEPIGTHQRSFEWYHPDPLRPPLPQDWGFATPCSQKPKTPITIISGTGEAVQTSNLARTFIYPSEQMTIKNFG